MVACLDRDLLVVHSPSASQREHTLYDIGNMPFNYRIPAQARTGPTLRLARGEHELLATGQWAA